MSHFACEKCGRTQVDKPGIGYIAGCSHYPPHHDFNVLIYFGGDNEIPTNAFYDGAWYKSAKSQSEGRAVHPVAWADPRYCDKPKLRISQYIAPHLAGYRGMEAVFEERPVDVVERFCEESNKWLAVNVIGDTVEG